VWLILVGLVLAALAALLASGTRATRLVPIMTEN